MGMEIRNRLEASLGLKLSATLVWDYPTLDALVTFLSTSSSPRPPPAEETPAPRPAATRSRELETEDAEGSRAVARRGGAGRTTR